ncbi:hypothetical protein JTB14_023757 [Gonioctena quinquepunctata]|nr:hypothetical protein JTB14_023757 [Gonioctena quinquepunctata]
MSAIENPCSRLEKLIKTLASSIFKQIGINNNAGNNNGIIYSFRREDYSRFIGELKESNLAEINLKTLESDVTRLVDSSEEVFQHDPKNIYVVADKCVTTEKDTYIPLVYNVLCVIFSQTNQKERCATPPPLTVLLQ